MLTYLKHYPTEKRKKIALWCTVGIAVVLVGILIIVYSAPVEQTTERTFSSTIVGGYTTILERAQSYFTGK